MKSLYAHIWGVKAKAVLRVEILVLLGVSNILGNICKRRNNGSHDAYDEVFSLSTIITTIWTRSWIVD